MRALAQASMPVVYKGKPVGDYFADILVEDRLVVELKCVERLSRDHIAQCLNYLKASGKSVCLLVNFERPKVEWRRVNWLGVVVAPGDGLLPGDGLDKG